LGRALTVFVLLLGVSCVEPYAPPISDEQAAAIMAVDGFIDGTNNIATVKLSYATALARVYRKGTLQKPGYWPSVTF
jgi:hypothetical protein